MGIASFNSIERASRRQLLLIQHENYSSIEMTQPSHSRKRVCYYYDSDIGNFYYGLETKSDEKEEVTKNINGEKDKDAKESEKKPEAAKAVTETSSTSPEETKGSKEERVTSTESSSPSVAAPTDTSKGDKPT